MAIRSTAGPRAELSHAGVNDAVAAGGLVAVGRRLAHVTDDRAGAVRGSDAGLVLGADETGNLMSRADERVDDRKPDVARRTCQEYAHRTLRTLS